jgi:hypothetical protein
MSQTVEDNNSTIASPTRSEAFDNEDFEAMDWSYG